MVGSALLAAGAEAAPTGTAPGISPAADSTTTSPRPGDTLTEVPAIWLGTPTTTSSQWFDCDSSGSNCTPIAGATTPSYTLTSNDVGHTIEVRETDTDSTGTTTLSSGPTLVVGLPVNQSPPKIFGSAQPGQTLIDVNGTWTNNPTSFSYQWLDCDGSGNNCTPIADAANQTYAPTANLVGNTVRVQETATNAGGAGTPVDSAQTPAVTLNSSTTDLLALPSSPVTNQALTLIATLTSSFASVPPAGTVSFYNGGAPIGGCASLPVATLNQSLHIVCPATFSAWNSPERLTAVFTPDAGSSLAGSVSPSVSLTIGQDSTSTALDVSNPTVFAGSKATYIATVTMLHTGPFQPTGSVEFRDSGQPISSCSSQPLVSSEGSGSAQCTVRYSNIRRHRITALYGGGAGFSGSASSQQVVSVERLPIHVRGTITSKISWTFRYTPRYTQVLRLLVRKATVGTTIVLKCHGRGCPFAGQSIRVTKVKVCSRRGSHRCVTEKSRTLDFSRRFGSSRLHLGTVLTVELTRHDWIGKAYIFSIRARRGPRYQIRCLAPGSTRPGVGC